VEVEKWTNSPRNYEEAYFFVFTQNMRNMLRQKQIIFPKTAALKYRFQVKPKILISRDQLLTKI